MVSGPVLPPLGTSGDIEHKCTRWYKIPCNSLALICSIMTGINERLNLATSEKGSGVVKESLISKRPVRVGFEGSKTSMHGAIDLLIKESCAYSTAARVE